MTLENKKRYLGLLAAFLGIGLLKLYSPTVDTPLSSDGVSAENCSFKVAENVKNQNGCDIFNQTDVDIMMQQDNGGEVLFAGCGGFF
ncbi:MAG: hypothetical protein HYT98_04325 [Candidatus Sungbacteria bacterium]|nr:hypothetical protein [Candidatus Sungbacteria bacterium]